MPVSLNAIFNDWGLQKIYRIITVAKTPAAPGIRKQIAISEYDTNRNLGKTMAEFCPHCLDEWAPESAKRYISEMTI